MIRMTKQKKEKTKKIICATLCVGGAVIGGLCCKRIYNTGYYHGWADAVGSADFVKKVDDITIMHF